MFGLFTKHVIENVGFCRIGDLFRAGPMGLCHGGECHRSFELPPVRDHSSLILDVK